MTHSDGSAMLSGYASIMVPMDLDPQTESRAKLAVNLADRFSSRLMGVAAQPITAPLYFETPISGVASIIEIEQHRAEENTRKAEARFRRIAGNRNNIEWRQALTFPLDHVLEQARAADLIVTGHSWREKYRFDPMTIDSGDLVMAVGRPVLFVPPDIEHLSAKRIIIGWKDSRESRRAVWDALPLLKGAQEVLVVSVGSDNHAAKDVAAYLRNHQVQVSALNQPAPMKSVGDELLRIAEQETSDLIVCGAYGHSRTREWVLGGVTRDLLDHASVCCLMAH